MDNSEQLLMGGTAIIVPGQVAYVELPHAVIRNYVDSKFPLLKNCPDADFIKGYGHRWKGGHDLLVDVPRTMMESGPLSALKQTGHILATDFPTKAGIPIPGLSGSGFGQWLVDAGIPKGYLSIHWADGCLGFLAIAEGSSDLLQAIHGTLLMNADTFFDTFVEGGIEIALAVAARSAWTLAAFNPVFAVVGAVENIIAGIISAYHTFSVYIDPLTFFGSAGTSALIGFGLSYGLAKESLSDATLDGLRAGAVGAFFSLSPVFGYGALAGFVAYKLGEKLAKMHNSTLRVLLRIDENAYDQLLEEMCRGNIHLGEFLNCAEIGISLVDTSVVLTTQSDVLDDETSILPESMPLLDSDARTIPGKTEYFAVRLRTLPDDSQVLSDWYREVLHN
ncbi:MAG: hypothetical protein PHD01_15075 [Geobacteraceae bacterium]|nr:hypothetical protein [Geobacteraceae bacterium]